MSDSEFDRWCQTSGLTPPEPAIHSQHDLLSLYCLALRANAVQERAPILVELANLWSATATLAVDTYALGGIASSHLWQPRQEWRH
jgi:hypothetical protein